jgi:rhomboid protease GluP
MKNARLKFRYIFKPFFLILITVWVGYTFLNWLLIIKLQLFPLKELVVDIVLPILLVWCIVYIFLRPRIKLLRLMGKNSNDNFYFLYLILSVTIISAPIVISQYYLKESAGNLLHLSSIEHINAYPPQKYYTVDTCYVDKNRAGVEVVFSVKSEKLDKQFATSLYVVMPMYSHPSDPLNNVSPYAWYGTVFHNYVDDDLNDTEKETEFRRFLSITETNLDYIDFNHFEYLEREGNTSEIDDYIAAIKNSELYTKVKVPFTILIPKHKPLSNRMVNTLLWGLGALAVGLFVFGIMVIIPSVDSEQMLHIGNKDRNFFKESARTFVTPLVPKGNSIITFILICVNLILFIAMAISNNTVTPFDDSVLIEWGAGSRYLIVEQGQWWRLFTGLFINSDFLSLSINMFVLYFIGTLIESLIGKRLIILVYLLTGICASLICIYWDDASLYVVRVSGYIMGLYGVLAAFVLTGVFKTDVMRFSAVSLILFIIYNLLMRQVGVVDDALYVGGWLSGFIIGLIIRFVLHRSNSLRREHKEG